MGIFKERERCCEATFRDGGPYWHAYTSGKETPLLFAREEDLVFVMNVVAQAAALFPEVRIIAFEVMDNHFHFVVSADEKAVLAFWGFVRKRLARSFPLMKGLQIALKPIGDLGALRNNIVYTNRNGYVADSCHTPFSYPWGTGRYYFLDWPKGKSWLGYLWTTGEECSDAALRCFRVSGRLPTVMLLRGTTAPSSSVCRYSGTRTITSLWSARTWRRMQSWLSDLKMVSFWRIRNCLPV